MICRGVEANVEATFIHFNQAADLLFRGSVGNFQATYMPIFLSAAVRFFNRSVTVSTRKLHNAKRHLITK